MNTNCLSAGAAATPPYYYDPFPAFSNKAKHIFLLIVFLLLLLVPRKSKAWGPDGHTIVVQLAMQFVKPDVKQNVQNLLDTMSLNTAANWMDIMRSNSDYDYMKPWHYIDFPADKEYAPSLDENIVNRLVLTFNELRHKRTLPGEQVKTDLLILFHLMGDLHQPLHTGYDDDLGGNKVAVQYDTLKTNLHHFWDEDIIRYRKITFVDCMALYNTYGGKKIDSIDGIHPGKWMKETRSFLGKVYPKQGFIVDDKYLNESKIIIQKQLLIAGLRLADMLNKLFVSESPTLNMKDVAARYENGVDAKDAVQYIGKKVTACSRVYGIKSLDNVTFINAGDKYPNSPLTIVIFAKDRKNFLPSIEELYNDKNICVKGEVVEYKGKAEIIVSRPEDIIVIN
ncbi:MAG: S1/P1 nuclease [Sphingobacteriales bacterium]|nr:S1/P1 nuclease [Sphingobacteriales bacterium]